MPSTSSKTFLFFIWFNCQLRIVLSVLDPIALTGPSLLITLAPYAVAVFLLYPGLFSLYLLTLLDWTDPDLDCIYIIFNAVIELSLQQSGIALGLPQTPSWVPSWPSPLGQKTIFFGWLKRLISLSPALLPNLTSTRFF